MARCAICKTFYEANPYEPPEPCDCGACAQAASKWDDDYEPTEEELWDESLRRLTQHAKRGEREADDN